MQRDPSLIPLSHQHHNALALCVLTRRSLSADASPSNIGRLAQRVIDRYEIELSNHFEIEETVLFPAIEGTLGNLPLIASLVAEHRQIEGFVSQLRATPSARLLEDLCELLTGHVRREENELFQMAQAKLSETTLRGLGSQIEARVVRVCL